MCVSPIIQGEYGDDAEDYYHAPPPTSARPQLSAYDTRVPENYAIVDDHGKENISVDPKCVNLFESNMWDSIFDQLIVYLPSLRLYGSFVG